MREGLTINQLAERNAQLVTENAALQQKLNKANELAIAFKEAEMVWEKTMMAAIGEDGVGSVSEAIAALKAERDAVLAENVVKGDVIDRLIGQYSCAGYHAVQNSLNPAQSLLYDAIQAQKAPATDALLDAVRAEGIHFAANRMLAAWDSGFIDDTPAQAYDISGAVLSAVEFLPDASPEDFKRDFADSIRAEIAAKPRAETDTTSSKYESLAGDQ